jgi:hypothetical protein
MRTTTAMEPPCSAVSLLSSADASPLPGAHADRLRIGRSLLRADPTPTTDPAAPHDPGYRPALRASGVTAFDVGGVHTCVTDAGGMRCWGNDWAGAVTGMVP